MIRLLIAEDSVTTREFLLEVLGSDPEIMIVGEARNGVEVVAMAKSLHPDIITMDVQMPLMDGFEATKQIMIEVPTPIIVLSGSTSLSESEIAVRALHMGALTALRKPVGPASPDFEKESRHLIRTVKEMAAISVVTHRHSRRVVTVAPSPLKRSGEIGQIVAIASSTGGPMALQLLLSGLPSTFPVPIMVVQHITDGFIAGMASWLSSVCSLNVKVASDGESLLPSTVYLAADNRHLGISSKRRVELSDAPSIRQFRPSGTHLFRSAAEVYRSATVAVILTGMGEDGVEGLRAVHERNGYIIAQDEASSVVFGMPGAAINAGLADAVLPLSAIADSLVNTVCQSGERT